MHYSQRYYDYPMMDGGNSLVGLLFMLLILGVIIWAAVYVARTMGQHMKTNGRQDPLDIARERYAKGEITKEELADIKKELK